MAFPIRDLGKTMFRLRCIYLPKWLKRGSAAFFIPNLYLNPNYDSIKLKFRILQQIL